MKAIAQKLSAAVLFAVAGTLLVVGCESSSDDRYTSRDSGYYSDRHWTASRHSDTNNDAPKLTYNTPAENNITGQVDTRTYSTTASTGYETPRDTRTNSTTDNSRYGRTPDTEYARTDQEGTRPDTRYSRSSPSVNPNETIAERDARIARENQMRRDNELARETDEARQERHAREMRESQNRRDAAASDRVYDSRYDRDSRWDSRRTDGTNYNDNTVEYKTDIYGRRFAAHPDNFEYIHDEQLGVYLIANTPSEYNGHRYDSRRAARDRDWSDDEYSERNRAMARDRDRDMNRDYNRDMASDTNRNNDRRNNSSYSTSNTDSAPVFTPVTRADTPAPTANPAPASTVTTTTPPRTDSPRIDSKDTVTPATAVTTTTPRTESQRIDSKETVQTFTSSWPSEQREAITALVAKYGQPDEMTASAVMWKDKGDFACTKVLKDAIDHKFPADHKDFLEQTVSYKVPTDMVDDLVAFDGSLIIDRTRGTLTARCGKEAHNILALNLANDIASGSKSVQEARSTLAEMAMASKNGQSDPYLQKLQFDVRSKNAADPDSPASNPRASTEGSK